MLEKYLCFFLLAIVSLARLRNVSQHERPMRVNAPRVSKLSFEGLSGEDKRIIPDEGSIGMGFYPRSIFDPVMRGQRSNFREVGNLFQMYKPISKKIYQA